MVIGTADIADNSLMGKRVGCLCLALFWSIAAMAGDSLPVIHTSVSEVRLTVVATDRAGRPVLNLSPSDVTVVEDGHAVGRVELRSAGELSLRIGIVLDLSASMRKSWPTTRTVLGDSLHRLLRRDDQILVMAFDNRIELEKVLSPMQTLDALEIPQPGGLTALYDTLYDVCRNQVFADAAEPRRSALILFSDGEDNLSRHDLDDAIESAQAAGIAVYSIATHSHKRRNAGDSVLSELASATGGRSFVAADGAELQSALTSIRDELRTSYLLYYRTPGGSDRKFRRVQLLPTEQNGLSLRSRAGYYLTHP